MEYYLRVVRTLEHYFGSKDWRKLFLDGGCYWLANLLHEGIPYSWIMINRCEEHCAVYFENGLYDIRGKISSRNYMYVTEKDISFMKKNYVPHFDISSLEDYLKQERIITR